MLILSNNSNTYCSNNFIVKWLVGDIRRYNLSPTFVTNIDIAVSCNMHFETSLHVFEFQSLRIFNGLFRMFESAWDEEKNYVESHMSAFIGRLAYYWYYFSLATFHMHKLWLSADRFWPRPTKNNFNFKFFSRKMGANFCDMDHMNGSPDFHSDFLTNQKLGRFSIKQPAGKCSCYANYENLCKYC